MSDLFECPLSRFQDCSFATQQMSPSPPCSISASYRLVVFSAHKIFSLISEKTSLLQKTQDFSKTLMINNMAESLSHASLSISFSY